MVARRSSSAPARMAIVALLALVAPANARQGAAPGTQAPQEPPQIQTPTFRTGVELVRVDVVASDREGRPVFDLTAGDFEITDEGKRQTVSAFKLVTSDGGRASAVPLPTSSNAVEEIDSSPDDVRLFAVFLDDYSVTPRWSSVAREQTARFVERILGPADLVAVMHPLTPLDSVKLARNRESVGAAIRKFDGVRGVNGGNSDPRRGSLTTIRRDASLTALKALIMRLGSLKEGRKTLILVTEGYGSSPDVLNSLREIGDLASRNNTAIYPVYARIAGPNFKDDVSVNGETMRVLAERSGGRLIFDGTRNSSEYRERVPQTGLPASRLSAAMEQIALDASAYYLLGYSAADAAPDGEFHKINVRVKRPGVELRYRKGYLSLRPGDIGRPTTSVPAPAAPVERTRAFDAASRERMVHTWVGMSRGEHGTRVTFAWDPRTPAGATVRDDERPVRLTLKATGANAVPMFEGSTPDSASRLSGSSASFVVPPGRMQLRFAIENAAGGVMDSDVQTITVPDLSASSTLMGTPAIYRARSVTEWRQLTSSVDTSPAAVRDFDRTDRLLMRVATYAAGGESTLTATLLNRTGQELTALKPSRSQAAGAGAGVWELELPLANLARGDYGVRLVVAADGVTASELVAFRVN